MTDGSPTLQVWLFNQKSFLAVSNAWSLLGTGVIKEHGRRCCDTCENVRLARRRLGRAMDRDWSNTPGLIKEAGQHLEVAAAQHRAGCRNQVAISLAKSELAEAEKYYYRGTAAVQQA